MPPIINCLDFVACASAGMGGPKVKEKSSVRISLWHVYNSSVPLSNAGRHTKALRTTDKFKVKHVCDCL